LIRWATFLMVLSCATGALADRSYTIRRGDTLARIARRFHVSIGDLREANDMGHRSRIREGEDLLIPTDDDDGPASRQHRPAPSLRGRVGSVALALALLSNPPPRRLVRRAGAGSEMPRSLAFPSPRLRVGRGFGSGPAGRHKALDIAARIGDRIRAAHRGFVVFAGELLGYGNAVMLVHPGGAVTIYGHLSQTSVRAGQTVARGRVIGRAGSTGNSTGPHLHFGLFVHGRPVDPAPLLDPQPVFGGMRHAREDAPAAEPGEEDEDVPSESAPEPEPAPTNGVELSRATDPA
jgi:murein DD-endopeptidase MepM/ murein hydrolase activator NlpD